MTIEKHINALAERDLHDLIDESVSESETLDYKEEMYPQTENGKKELLRDVSSMANARGGYLLIGIRERNEVAAELVGIEAADVTTERVLSSCLSGIHERINGLDAKPVRLSSGRSVVAVYVPPSTRIPHMVIYKDEDRCWIRHGRQKMRMSVEEIRETCLRVERLVEDVEKFLARQNQRLLALVEKNSQEPVLRIAMTPLPVHRDRINISDADVRSIMKEPRMMRSGGWVIRWPLNYFAHPTMEGLKVEIPTVQALEVFRNGHAEFRVAINRDSQFHEVDLKSGGKVRFFDPYAIAEYTVSMFRFYKELAENVGILEPAVVSWQMFNALGWGLWPHGEGEWPVVDDRYSTQPIRWKDERHLLLPPLQVTELQEAEKLAKLVLDRVWQCFAEEACPLFDAHGTFLLR